MNENVLLDISSATDEEMDKFIAEMVQQGYITEDGKPLKCGCGCRDFKETDSYYDEQSLVEYTLVCKACGEEVGHWAYGYWEMYR